MKKLVFLLGLALLTASNALAQSAPWYIVRTPPGVTVAGPFPDYSSCLRATGTYRGSDFRHTYNCEIRY